MTQISKISESNDCLGREIEEELHRRTFELTKKIKELQCIYGISSLTGGKKASLEEILAGIVHLIPPALMGPGRSCARIEFGGQVFQTRNFCDMPWRSRTKIFSHTELVGHLEVRCLYGDKNRGEGHFMDENRRLLEVVAEMAGKTIERMETKAFLQESEERYRILARYVADGVVLLQNGRILFVNDSLASMLGYPEGEEIIGRPADNLISDDDKKSFRILSEEIIKRNMEKGIFRGACLSADGGEVWVEARFSRIQWKGAPALLGIVRDGTEIRRRDIKILEKSDHFKWEDIQLRQGIKNPYRLLDLTGKSSAMQKVYELILMAASSDVSVVISGESGTGKELVARAIHHFSGRNKKPFVPVNCGAIPKSLFENEFFGHRKGAFTGAHADKQGFFDLAEGGTLFLDEVGELSLEMQVKLLRSIEGHGYIPVGGTRIKKTDVRIVAATNRDLKVMLTRDLIRKDFFYRIHIVPIALPPLRQRREDIPLLVDHFLRIYHAGAKGQPGIPGKVMDALCKYDWPGNVRELQNVLRRYVTTKHLDFMTHTIPVSTDAMYSPFEEVDLEGLNFRHAMDSFQKILISRALNQSRQHKGQAADILGMDRKTLFRKMKCLGLE